MIDRNSIPPIGSFVVLERTWRALSALPVYGLLIRWEDCEPESPVADMIGTADILCSDGAVCGFFVHTSDTFKTLC